MLIITTFQTNVEQDNEDELIQLYIQKVKGQFH